MKLNTEMYDLQGNRVIIEKVDKKNIYAVVNRVLEINYNSGYNIDKQIVEQPVNFNKDDLGIRLFFSKDDIIQHKKLNINDKRYLDNYNNIYEHFSSEYNSIANEIKQDKPIGTILTSEQKEKIIRSYYLYKENMKTEKAFHLKNNGCFGRIDLDTEFYRTNYEIYHREHYYDKVYISKDKYHAYGDIHIVNWRSPIASMFYDNENTKLARRSYVDIVNETRTYTNDLNQEVELKLGNPLNVYNHELMLKRKYSFNPFNYINTYIANDDELYIEGSVDSFLLEALEENRTNHKITDIIKSIQSNQNKIIRHAAYNNMLIQGCAGSGKTMILLHRISYLLFNALLPAASEVKIITPNENFAEFISGLVNSLELDAIERTTMFKYYLSLTKRYQKTFSTVEKKDEKGKLSNKEEIVCIKDALNYFMDKFNDFTEEADSIYEKKINFSEQFFDNIQSKYIEQVKEFCENANSDMLLTIAERTGAKYDTSLKYGSKYYFDSLYNLSFNGVLSANEIMSNNIKKLQENLEKSKYGINVLKNLSGDFRVIESYITILKEENTSGKSIEYLTSVRDRLIRLNKLYFEKTDYLNTINAEYRKKSTDLQKEISELKSKVKSIPLNQFNLIISLNKLISTKASLSIYLTNDHEKDYYKTKSELKNIKNEFDNLIKTEFPNLEEPLSQVNYLEQINKSISELSKKYKIPFYSDAKIAEVKVQFINKINSINKDLSIIKFEENLYDESNYKNDVRYLAELKSALIDIRQQIGKVDLNIFNRCHESINSLKEIIISHSKNLSIKQEELSKLLLTDDEKAKLLEIYKKLQKRGTFVINAYEKIRDILRLRLNINSNKKVAGKIEIIILLYLYYLHCGQLSEKDRFLFVDEGQDYSILEYKLLKLINGDKCTFNIFGDVKQLLNSATGIEGWESLKELFDYDYYELRENYRNTVEITNFVNKKFNYELNPIGVHGKEVQYIEFTQIADIIETEIKADTENRIAVISKNKTDNIMSSKYNNVFWYTVKEVKGLEFDIAFVITDGMNKNEEYISYTRALNKLYVI